jgi:hypothetical protein
MTHQRGQVSASGRMFPMNHIVNGAPKQQAARKPVSPAACPVEDPTEYLTGFNRARPPPRLEGFSCLRFTLTRIKSGRGQETRAQRAESR